MKYADLISRLTLTEKASLMSGQNFWNTKAIERLGIPSMMLTDGPHGLRKQGGKADHLGLNASIPATCFPTASGLANSWNTELMEMVGACLGKEAAAENVSVLLGPGLNIKRNPLCGRNFEYFSEDPYLSGKLAAAMIRGIQSEGVSACPKHFAVNSQEERRMVIDEIVDERALRELYLEGFRYAVNEGRPKALMTAYNRVNGAFANENEHLLCDILYGEWGYDGVVVTDWGGNNDRVASLKMGNQLEMPSTSGMTDAEIVQAVQVGELDEGVLNESVDRLLTLLFDTQKALGRGKRYTQEEHHEAARKAAKQSAVLLKNEGGILPLKADARVAVLGDFAKKPRYQGAGSSLIVPTKLDNALDALKGSELTIVGYAASFDRLGKPSIRKRRQALKLAKKADICLLFLGQDEGSEAEGIDRAHLRLPQNQIDLLYAVRQVCTKVVVVLSGGSPVETPWVEAADAVLHLYLSGQAGGSAAADLLTGRAVPCGKLAESFPVYYADVPNAPYYPGKQLTAEHRESIYIGYRYYDSANVKVAWPFGHGLSYSSFSYGDLSVSGSTVCFSVSNTGKYPAAEVAQIYVSACDRAVFHPAKELKGFVRVELLPGETKAVEVALDEHAFAYYDVLRHAWVTETGRYLIHVGASSRDIRLQQEHTVQGVPTAVIPEQERLPHYYTADVQHVPDEEFVLLLGRSLPQSQWDESKPLGYNDTIGQGAYKKGFAHFLYCLVCLVRKTCLLMSKPIAANNVLFAMNLPYRSLARMSGGRVDMAMLDGILVMANGQFLTGLRQMLAAWRSKKKRGRSESK